MLRETEAAQVGRRVDVGERVRRADRTPLLLRQLVEVDRRPTARSDRSPAASAVAARVERGRRRSARTRTAAARRRPGSTVRVARASPRSAAGSAASTNGRSHASSTTGPRVAERTARPRPTRRAGPSPAGPRARTAARSRPNRPRRRDRTPRQAPAPRAPRASRPARRCVALSVAIRRLAPPVSRIPGDARHDASRARRRGLGVGPERVADDDPTVRGVVEHHVVAHRAAVGGDPGHDERGLGCRPPTSRR